MGQEDQDMEFDYEAADAADAAAGTGYSGEFFPQQKEEASIDAASSAPSRSSAAFRGAAVPRTPAVSRSSAASRVAAVPRTPSSEIIFLDLDSDAEESGKESHPLAL